MTTRTQARPLFAAKLTPHRSLGRRGLQVVAALAAILTLVPAAILLSLGAWPVATFLGFGLLLIWWALQASTRAGRQYEEVTLWPHQLQLRKVSARGKEQLLDFDPALVRLVLDRDINEHTTALHLRSGETMTEIGAFLNPDDKASFAKVFGTALKRARH